MKPYIFDFCDCSGRGGPEPRPHPLDPRMGHSVSLCELLRVIAIERIECDHFCIFICIEISVAIF